MTRLSDAFLKTPIAHRALHDVADGRPENSRAAIRAAMQAGYGIEIDLQLTKDGQAMVFHDYHLSRLAQAEGMVRDRTVDELSSIQLIGGDEDIPTFPEVLQLVAGQVPLLIELKDQDGQMGTDIGPLEEATASALSSYEGPVALMSFNPNSVARMADLCPNIPRGIVTSAYDPKIWTPLTSDICDHLREIPDYDRTQSSFVSHEVSDLDRPRVAELKAQGAHILCWTVKSPDIEARARRVAENVTFEGYLSEIPA